MVMLDTRAVLIPNNLRIGNQASLAYPDSFILIRLPACHMT